jgi:hypothetical protein
MIVLTAANQESAEKLQRLMPAAAITR